MIPMQKQISSLQGTRVPHRKAYLRPDNELLTRTSWADAAIASAQISKGKAFGNSAALWMRTQLQKRLLRLGNIIERNPWKILIVGVILFLCLCAGLKSIKMETDIEKLWVEEGGRLEKELEYIRRTTGEGVGSISQILIHTPKEEGTNVLHPDILLAHLQVLKAATQVKVEVDGEEWSFKNLCYSPSFPVVEKHYIDMTLENLFPCAIITPLDCFWEGSKLLGPDPPVKIPGVNVYVQWTNLNPQWLMESTKSFGNEISSNPLHTVEAFMKRAGITTAYQEKPCLRPDDEHCPNSAPNKKRPQKLDIGAELTGGCFGFATKYMHWPEDLLVGGVTKNKTGYIKSAKALQTIIQLMAEKEVFEFWRDDIKVQYLDWSVEKAKEVLEAWQRKFTEAVLTESQTPNVTRRSSVSVFSTTSLGDIMKDFSEMSIPRVAFHFVAMLLYTIFAFYKLCDPVNSFGGIGAIGVTFIALSVAAGLGFCAILGIVFTAATTQVVPYLALGLGMNDMFLIAQQYAQTSKSDLAQQEHLTGEILKRIGSAIVLTFSSRACAFFVAVIIPIPALRLFTLQTAILMFFTTGTVLLMFPAVISIDVKRRRSKRVDILCCVTWKDDTSCLPCDEQQLQPLQSDCPSDGTPLRHAVAHALPPDCSHVVTVLAPSHQKHNRHALNRTSTEYPSQEDPLKKPIEEEDISIVCARDFTHISLLSWFVSEQLAPTLQKTPYKFLTILFCIVLLGIGGWGISHVKDGLDLTDIVPRNTSEYDFLSKRAKYFGFFNMHAVTQGNFSYPTNQRLLYEYNDAFIRIQRIIKNDDGGLPDFWLSMFRDWLEGLQKVFDEHWKTGCINEEGWCSNATEYGILAYKLLVQTGRIDNPVDKSLVRTIRLVDKNGIINPKAFYNYLTAWVSNDPLAYSFSQANLVPEPRRWIHDPLDIELKVPKSQPLVYAQIPFFLNKMGTTEEIIETIREIRNLCLKFEEKGLPNFPTGLPFIYWEQYLELRNYLWLALACIFIAIFLVISFFLVNIWAALLVIIHLAVILVELFGFMGIMGIKLSAVPAVILIAAIGVGMEFSAPLMMAFLTSIGSREKRMVMALEQMFPPVVHGAASTLISVIMLAFSEFDFIFRYFFIVLCALVILGLLNGFILFPVVLSIIGPPGEVRPKDNPERIATPSPEASPIRQRIRHARPFNSRRMYPRMPSEISLSTITEESSSCGSSHEIVVQPEVIVETTTVTNTSNGATTVNTTTSTPESASDSQSEDHSKCNTPNGENVSTTTTTNTSTTCGNPCGNQPSITTQTAVTTRVTATAKVKVEVHGPTLSSSESSRYRRRRDSCSSRSSSARSSPT